MTLDSKYDKQFNGMYEALDYLIKKDKQLDKQQQRKRIGFKTDPTKNETTTHPK